MSTWFQRIQTYICVICTTSRHRIDAGCWNHASYEKPLLYIVNPFAADVCEVLIILAIIYPAEHNKTIPCTLTCWGRVTHKCVGNLTIIGSNNGLSPCRRQAITWTNVGILLIGPSGTNFSEMLIQVHTFSFKQIHLKMSSGKWKPFCLGLNVLTCSLRFIPVSVFLPS